MKEEISFDLPKHKSSIIKVFGIGGGGTNAVNYMYNQGIIGVDFIVCNTDSQALDNSPVTNKIQLGASITEGLGAGANPEIGEQAAIETIEKIKEVLEINTKMIFITAGMGGGTGTGAAPIIAKCAREMGILTVGIVTVPFNFEGEKRIEFAEMGLEKLRHNVDSLIVINNNRLRELYGNLGYKAGFSKSDEILSNAAKGIAEIITQNYQVNIDLNDVKRVLSDSGTAIMGSAYGEGPNRAQDAISKALDSPLLNDNKITGAKNVLLLIVSGENEITMDEIAIINEYIQNEAGNHAHIIMGIGENHEEEDKIMVMVVATGFKQEQNLITSSTTNKKSYTNEFFSLKSSNITNIVNKKNNKLGEKVRYVLDDDNTLKKKLNPKNEIHSTFYTTNSRNSALDKSCIINAPNQFKTLTKKIPHNKVSNQIIRSNSFIKNDLNNNLIINNKKNKFNFDNYSSNNKTIKIVHDISEKDDQIIHTTKSRENCHNSKQIQSFIRQRKEKSKSHDIDYQNITSLSELEKTPAYIRSGINLDFDSPSNSK